MAAEHDDKRRPTLAEQIAWVREMRDDHVAGVKQRGDEEGPGTWMIEALLRSLESLPSAVVPNRDEIIEECARVGWEASMNGAPVGYSIRMLKNAAPQVVAQPALASDGRPASVGGSAEPAVAASSIASSVVAHTVLEGVPRYYVAVTTPNDKTTQFEYPICDEPRSGFRQSPNGAWMRTFDVMKALEAPSSAMRSNTYWLIERGSPAEWWGGSEVGWTNDVFKVHPLLRFKDRESAQIEAERIQHWQQVEGSVLRVTGHMDCAPSDPTDSRGDHA